jgi:hypothetical protein
MAQARPASLHIQDRDIALLRGLFECRAMSAEHITELYFDGRKEAAKKRLQALKSAGFLAERPRKPFESAVLSLTRTGIVPLSERGILSEYPAFSLDALEKRARVSDLTIRHELEVMDVKTAFHRATRKASGLALAEFNTWPLLNQFTAMRPDGGEALVKPDGFIRIHEEENDGSTSEHAFFLEVDRSTESQDVLLARANCYLDYYRSGGFAERNGAPRESFREYPFRVLVVLKTEERRNNFAERLLWNEPPILSQVWLSTHSEASSDPLGPIWMRSQDYRDALSQAGMLLDAPRNGFGYQRRAARDAHVARSVPKMHLVERA